MKKIIKQIKEEGLSILKHVESVKHDHIFKCDVVMGDDINIIQDKTKLILGLVEGLEKEIE